MLQTKEEIATDVREELSKVMSTFGFEILQALVTDIDPAPRVKDAMNEINAAQRLRCAAACHVHLTDLVHTDHVNTACA